MKISYEDKNVTPIPEGYLKGDREYKSLKKIPKKYRECEVGYLKREILLGGNK